MDEFKLPKRLLLDSFRGLMYALAILALYLIANDVNTAFQYLAV